MNFWPEIVVNMFFEGKDFTTFIPVITFSLTSEVCFGRQDSKE